MSIPTEARSSPNTEGTNGRELDVPARARVARTRYGRWDIHRACMTCTVHVRNGIPHAQLACSHCTEVMILDTRLVYSAFSSDYTGAV